VRVCAEREGERRSEGKRDIETELYAANREIASEVVGFLEYTHTLSEIHIHLCTYICACLDIYLYL